MEICTRSMKIIRAGYLHRRPCQSPTLRHFHHCPPCSLGTLQRVVHGPYQFGLCLESSVDPNSSSATNVKKVVGKPLLDCLESNAHLTSGSSSLVMFYVCKSLHPSYFNDSVCIYYRGVVQEELCSVHAGRSKTSTDSRKIVTSEPRVLPILGRFLCISVGPADTNGQFRCTSLSAE